MTSFSEIVKVPILPIARCRPFLDGPDLSFSSEKISFTSQDPLRDFFACLKLFEMQDVNRRGRMARVMKYFISIIEVKKRIKEIRSVWSH